MLPKNKLLLLPWICLLFSCSEEQPDYSIKRPAALSLPEIKRDNSITDSSEWKGVSVEEAVKQSSEVFSGVLLSVDSNDYRRQHSLPVYLFNVKVKRSWKGNFSKESNVNFISRAMIATSTEKESLFFLMPVDSANVFSAGKKLSWQWTFNAPQSLPVNDSMDNVLKQAMMKQP